MQARDIMTIDVETISPETSMQDIVRSLMARNISAVPVVDGKGEVVGIVSEGDLIRRQEIGTDAHPSWWLGWLLSVEELAERYAKAHGLQARELMTTPVISVEEDTPIARIAELFEDHGIKRVPVVREGKLVGIVSRADLLRGLAVKKEAADLGRSDDDAALRNDVLGVMRKDAGIRSEYVNVIVSDGVAHLWGAVWSEEERRAARVAAGTVVGADRVQDHLGILPPTVRALIQGE